MYLRKPLFFVKIDCLGGEQYFFKNEKSRVIHNRIWQGDTTNEAKNNFLKFCLIFFVFKFRWQDPTVWFIVIPAFRGIVITIDMEQVTISYAS